MSETPTRRHDHSFVWKPHYAKESYKTRHPTAPDIDGLTIQTYRRMGIPMPRYVDQMPYWVNIQLFKPHWVDDIPTAATEWTQLPDDIKAMFLCNSNMRFINIRQIMSLNGTLPKILIATPPNAWIRFASIRGNIPRYKYLNAFIREYRDDMDRLAKPLGYTTKHTLLTQLNKWSSSFSDGRAPIHTLIHQQLLPNKITQLRQSNWTRCIVDDLHASQMTGPHIRTLSEMRPLFMRHHCPIRKWIDNLCHEDNVIHLRIANRARDEQQAPAGALKRIREGESSTDSSPDDTTESSSRTSSQCSPSGSFASVESSNPRPMTINEQFAPLLEDPML